MVKRIIKYFTCALAFALFVGGFCFFAPQKTSDKVDAATISVAKRYVNSSWVGYSTLEAAINAATSGETIVVTSNYILSAKITLNKNITLVSDNNNVILKSFAEAAIEVPASYTLTLGSEQDTYQGLTLTTLTFDGNKQNIESSQALIVNKGTLITYANCIIQNNKNTGDAWGGGVLNSTAGTMIMYGGIIRNNESRVWAGGIYNSSSLTIYDALICNNSVRLTRSAGRSPLGGGIYNAANSATKEAKIYNATIVGNIVHTTSYGSGYGGGIATAGDSTLYVENAVVSDNYADYGAGVYLYDDSVIENITITNNTAKSGGGAIYNSSKSIIKSGVISGNACLDKPASNGVYLSSYYIQITNKVIINDACLSSWGHFEVTEKLENPEQIIKISAYNLSNSTLDGKYPLVTFTNSEDFDMSKFEYYDDSCILVQGVENPNNIYLSQVVAKIYDKDGQKWKYFTTLESALDAAQNEDTVVVSSDYTLASTYTISKNITLVSDRNSIIKKSCSGPAFYVFSSESCQVNIGSEEKEYQGLTLTDITIDGDQANVTSLSPLIWTYNDLFLYDGAVIQNSNYGAIRVTSGSLNMYGGVIRNNTAPNGGAIINNGGVVGIVGGEIYGNTATGNGGAIYNSEGADGDLKLYGGKIYDNSSTSKGQQIYDAGMGDSVILVANGIEVVGEIYIPRETQIKLVANMEGSTPFEITVGYPSEYIYGKNPFIVLLEQSYFDFLDCFILSCEGYRFVRDLQNPNDVYLSNIYTITFDENYPGGTTQSKDYEYGATIEMPTNPTREHYLFDGWCATADCTVGFEFGTMPAQNIVVYAQWQLKSYALVVEVQGNGVVSPYGTMSLVAFESQKILVQPTMGYYISDVLVNGVSIGEQGVKIVQISNEYVVENITSNMSVEFVFEQHKYTITVVQCENGQISQANESYNYGSNATFTITPNQGYHVDYLIIDNQKVAAATSYKFQDIKANHTISAYIVANTNTAYTVNLWQQNIKKEGTLFDGKFYTKVDTKTLYGTTNNHTNVTAQETEGFTALSIEQKVIAGDGTTVVNVFYTRNIYKLYLAPSVGVETVVGAGEYMYGQTVEISATLKQGYNWVGWKDTQTEVTEIGYIEYSLVIPARNLGYIAQAEIKTFTITVADCDNGEITLSTSNVVEYGQTVIVTLQGAQGYILQSLVLDSVDVTNQVEGNQYVLQNVVEHHSISATFVKQTFKITANAGQNGAISPDFETMVEYGQNQKYVFQPNTGYYVYSIKVDGVALVDNRLEQAIENGYTFTNVVSEHTISVEFAKIVYTITVAVMGQGTVTPGETTGISVGESKTFAFSPAKNNVIKDVKVNGVSQGAIGSYTFENVLSDQILLVEFKQITHTISVVCGQNGTISPSGDITVAQGSDQTFVITPNPGYKIQQLVVDGVLLVATDSYTFENIKTSHTIEVSFAQQDAQEFAVVVMSKKDGATFDYKEQTLCLGESQVVKFAQYAGLCVSEIFVNGVTLTTSELASAISNGYTINNIEKDYRIEVVYQGNTYSVSVQVVGNGHVTPSNLTEIKYGQVVDMQFVPNSGYKIKNVKINGTSVGAVTYYVLKEVQTEQTIVVEFERISYTIVATCGANGTISPSGSVTVYQGEDKTFVISPNSGYKIKQLKVDEVLVVATESYTFENIICAHKIEVEFEKQSAQSFELTVRLKKDGDVFDVQNDTIASGDSKVITIATIAGHYVSEISTNGVKLSATEVANIVQNGYNLQNVTKDYNIEIVYSKSSYPVSVSVVGNGTVSPNGITSIQYGQVIDMQFVASAGSRIKDVKVNGISVGAVAYYVLKDVMVQQTIVVEFEQITHTITVSCGQNGSATPATSTVTQGESKTISIVPNAGYKIEHLRIDGVSIEPTTTYTFANISQSHLVEVEFAQIKYAVAITIDGSGKVTPSIDINNIKYGDNLILEVSPEQGWQIAAVYVNGKKATILENNTISVAEISQDLSIQVLYIQATTENPEENPEGSDDSEKDKSGNQMNLVIIVAGAGCVIVILLVVCIAYLAKVRKGQKQQGEGEEILSTNVEATPVATQASVESEETVATEKVADTDKTSVAQRLVEIEKTLVTKTPSTTQKTVVEPKVEKQPTPPTRPNIPNPTASRQQPPPPPKPPVKPKK